MKNVNKNTEIEKTVDNEYEAKVSGTELYTVKVVLDNEANIIDENIRFIGEIIKSGKLSLADRENIFDASIKESESSLIVIESAMEKKEYDNVIKLALDGEKKSENFFGHINQWKEYRYKAFKLSGNIDGERKIAVDFILDGSIEYYDKLKSTYGKEEWRLIYPKIISSLERKKRIFSNISRKDHHR